MDPYHAVLYQSTGLTFCLAVSWYYDYPILLGIVISALAVLLLVGIYLATSYGLRLRGADAVGSRTSWRRRGDVLAASELVVPIAVLGTLMLAWPSPGAGDHVGSLEVATLFAFCAVMLAVVLASSLVDWWYVRPRRDGLVRLPPCMSSGAEVWDRVTRIWFWHRTFGELAFVLFFVITGPVMIIEAIFVESSGYAWISKVIGPVFTVAGIGVGASKKQLPVGFHAIRTPPGFAIGDTISWRISPSYLARRDQRRARILGYEFTMGRHRRKRRNGTSRRLHRDDHHYVFDVALDNVTVFKLRAPRKGPFMAPRKVPTAALIEDGAITSRTFPSPCLAAGRCLAMHADCARISEPVAPSPGADRDGSRSRARR